MGAFRIPIIIDTNGKVKQTLSGGTYYSITNRVLLKKNDAANLSIQFVQAGNYVPFLLTSGATIQVALKEKGKYGAGLTYAAFTSAVYTPASSTDPYLIQLPISGSVVDTLFGTAPTENPYVDLMFEVTWSEDGGATWNSTSDPIEARVYNDVIRPATNVPALPPSLNIPQVYRTSGVISAVDGTLIKVVDLATIFGLREGDVAQFQITGGSYVRAAYAANTPTQTDCVHTLKSFVVVDFSSPFNYDDSLDVPVIPAPFWDELLIGNSAKWGTLSTTIEGGGLTDLDPTFNQAGAISLTFAHTASTSPPPNDQAAITDVQCFVQIELLSVTNSVID